MTTLPDDGRQPKGRGARIVEATCAVAGVLCIAYAAFGARDDYDTPLYTLALVLLSAWAFLFLTGYRKRRRPVNGQNPA